MVAFAEVAELAERLAAEPGRLKKRAAIAESLAAAAAISVQDAGRLCLYLAGQSFAEADPRKLSAGGALLSRAILEIAQCSEAALSLAYRKYGDLGAAAEELLTVALTSGIRNAGQPQLRLIEIEDAFAAMASARTTAARAATVNDLLRRASALEAKYLIKLMLADMRIGVKQSLIEEAIAVASGTQAASVRHAVMLEADLARAVERAFAGTLDEAHMRLFHPLGFMLASPVETQEEAMERFGGEGVAGLEEDADSSATLQNDEPETQRSVSRKNVQAFLEDKYDGMRAQLHCGDPEQPRRVALYSRNREDITESFPEIVEAFANVTQPLILDGELLGWDFAADKALPFSVLGQRIGRKRVDAAVRRQIPVIFMAFDLLLEGGDLLLPLPLRDRRARLEAVVANISMGTRSPLEVTRAQHSLFETVQETQVQRLRLSPSTLVESAEQIDRAYADARLRANEGVMLKAADSIYQPGRRGLAWVKLKRELATLDVVITGAEFGHGRRAGLLSDYTFAVRGPGAKGDVGGDLLNVGKAYSGLTDVEVAEMSAWLKEHTLEDHGHFRTVEPLRVLEVAFNNVMRSDRHSSGFALRFPRILHIRNDKPLEEIDTLERVEEIFQSQPDKGRE